MIKMLSNPSIIRTYKTQVYKNKLIRNVTSETVLVTKLNQGYYSNGYNSNIKHFEILRR